jgi:DNA-directed RNA polymerase II subunit RPB1
MTDILNYSKCDKTTFFVSGDDNISNTAAVQVFTNAKFNDRKPIVDGLYDSRMGTLNNSYVCGTCKHNNTECIGHIGRYLLNTSIVQFIYTKYISKCMNIECARCYKIIMNPELKYSDGTYVYPDHPVHNAEVLDFNDIISYIHDQKTKKASRPNYCDYCNNLDKYLSTNTNLKKFYPTTVQPQYKKIKVQMDLADKLLVLEERTEFRDESKGYITNKRLRDINEYAILMFPDDCKKRFEMLKDEELLKHGISIQSHFKNFIIRELVIPPVNMRHPNRNKNEIYNDFITSALDSIITSDRLVENISYHDASQFTIQLKRVVDVATKYSNYISAGSSEEHDVTSIIDLVKGKKGVIRDRCLGKLVARVFRCVITCNIENPIDVIDLPLAFAMTMHFQETVTPFNIKRLQTYVNNCDQYPGCNRIKMIAKGHGTYKNIGTYSLQVGDIVSRNVINGDTLPVTRFPSLFVTSTVNVYIKVHNEEKENNAIGTNVILCAFFNGDFDGDTMSGFYSTSEAARAEYDILGNIRRNITSGIDGTITIGQAQDTIAGCGFLTMESTKLNIMQVKAIMNGVSASFKLENRSYEGRELFSMVMPRITLERESPFFKNELVKYFYKYDEKDLIVKIVDGKLISGIVCDSLIKIQKKDTIYHIIYNYYGADVAIKTVHNHQIMIKNFLRIYGITLDYDSFRLSDGVKEIIRVIRSSVIYKINGIMTKLIDGKITPPSGIHIYNHIETLIKNEYKSIGNKYIGAVLSDPNINNNWLVKMCLMGSKGSFDNIEKLLVSIGQVYLEQKRTPFLLDFFRTTIWSQQFSLSPESRGFVHASLMDGYNLENLYSLAREARNNIITKGLVTAEAGTEGRNVIKNSETLIVDNRLFISRDKGTLILQFSAGDDGIDTKQLFKSQYVLFGKDEKYIHDNYNKLIVEKILLERKEFINNMLLKERNNFSFTGSSNILSPLNMPQIINIILGQESIKEDFSGDDYEVYKYRHSTMYGAKEVNTDFLVKTINDYCDTLHHKRFGLSFIKYMTEGKREIPKIFISAFDTMRIVIRSTFDNSVLKRIVNTGNPQVALETILAKITNQIITSIIEPGLAYGINISLTLTSPFTQYLIDAHHASASGGTSRDDIKQFKSIIYLKDSSKMHNRRTYIFLKPEYETNYDNVLRLANYVETQYLREYTFEIRGLCEKIGSFITYPEDTIEIKKAMAIMGIDTKNKHNFYYRMIMLKDKMLSKNVDINMFINKINNLFDDISCAYYSKEDKYILYMFINKGFSFKNPGKKNKSRDDDLLERATEFAKYLYDKFIINDFEDLNNVKVLSLTRNIMKDDKLEKQTIYYVEADGINLEDIYCINVVDTSRTFCNNIQEIYKYCGFLETRNKIIDILNGIFTASLDLMVTNYVMIADIMMELGKPTGLTVSGLAERETKDKIITAAYKHPMVSFVEAATNGLINNINSPSACLIMGQVPEMGSYYNRVVRNPDFKIEADNVEDIL